MSLDQRPYAPFRIGEMGFFYRNSGLKRLEIQLFSARVSIFELAFDARPSLCASKTDVFVRSLR